MEASRIAEGALADQCSVGPPCDPSLSNPPDRPSTHTTIYVEAMVKGGVWSLDGLTLHEDAPTAHDFSLVEDNEVPCPVFSQKKR